MENVRFLSRIGHAGRIRKWIIVFGFDCFQLRYHIGSTNMPEYLRNNITSHLQAGLKARLDLTVDLVVPFDTSKYPLKKTYSVDFSMLIDGKNAGLSDGHTIVNIISQSKPLTMK
jgi:hypothetical protein